MVQAEAVPGATLANPVTGKGARVAAQRDVAFGTDDGLVGGCGWVEAVCVASWAGDEGGAAEEPECCEQSVDGSREGKQVSKL